VAYYLIGALRHPGVITPIMYVSSVCSKCFICSKCTLQAFYLDVAKVDLDVAYTCMLQAYVKCFSDVSYVCYKYFIWMLHMFCNSFHLFLSVFASVSDACFKGFICLLLYVALLHQGRSLARCAGTVGR
jgi:hypothetical protein